MYNTEHCDQKIYEGSTVIVLKTQKIETELFVKFLRTLTGQRIDWHYFAGYSAVKVHPDDDFNKVAQIALNCGISSISSYISSYENEYQQYLHQNGYFDSPDKTPGTNKRINGKRRVVELDIK